MIRGTTPTLLLTIKGQQDLDLNQADEIVVSLRQPPKALDLQGDQIEVQDLNALAVFLTQQETLDFINGLPCKIQVNWTYADPTGGSKRRAATIVTTIPIEEQLLDEVI